MGDYHVVMGILVPCAYQSMVHTGNACSEKQVSSQRTPLSMEKRQWEKKGQVSSNSLCRGGQMTIKQDQAGLVWSRQSTWQVAWFHPQLPWAQG